MALSQKVTKSLTVGPTMPLSGKQVTAPGVDPPNPADTLRTGGLPRRTFPTTPPGKPFERKDVVNLYRRDEPSPEDYCEPRPGDEDSVGAEKYGPQMTPPKGGDKTTQGQDIRGSC
jgi:hypothetical protein